MYTYNYTVYYTHAYAHTQKHIPQPNNLDTLVASLGEIASKQPDTRIKDEAHAVAEKFKVIFTLFGNCHRIYNKCTLTEAEIDELSK